MCASIRRGTYGRVVPRPARPTPHTHQHIAGAGTDDGTPRTGGHHCRFGVQSLHCVEFPNLSTVIAHFRDVLGDQAYESLARNCETVTTAARVAYGYDQIDQARTELDAVSNRP